MTEPASISAPPRFWPRLNAALFVVTHLAFVLGLRFAFDTFLALLGGITLGLVAYTSWRFRPALWRRPATSIALVVLAIGAVASFDALITPPPDPPSLAIERGEDGKWYFNRGGDVLFGRVYMVLPEATEEASSPFVVGAVKVTASVGIDRSKVEWLVSRKRFRDRPRYRVRPLRPGEHIPGPSTFVTLVELLGEGRGRIDAGEVQGVRAGLGYAFFGPGIVGSNGYFIVDRVDLQSADGYLVDAEARVPQDLDANAPVQNLVQLALVKGDVAFQGGRIEDARASYQQALELSGGADDRALERLKKLEK